MGADRTLMQVKVRCGLGRVGVLGRLYGNSRGMSAPGQTRTSARSRTTSALAPGADIDERVIGIYRRPCGHMPDEWIRVQGQQPNMVRP